MKNFPIHFFFEDVDFGIPFQEENLQTWLEFIINAEEKKLSSISYIFCSDRYLHSINLEYLQHDNYTDIITFPYTSPPIIEGDIFISVDRLKENAEKFKVSFSEEFLRVVAHGLLHLCGYNDKTEKEKSIMREKENDALKSFRSLISST